MTQVDFYILQKSSAAAIYPFACRLLTKAYDQQSQVQIYFNNENEAQSFDQLLWTFNENSFIPHALASDKIAKTAPIVLTWPENCDTKKTILVNLNHQAAKAENNYQRIIEIVPDEETWLVQSRQKYATYKKLDWELQTHKIS